jgi:hypothetical protein
VNGARGRWSYLVGICLVVLVLVMSLVTIERQASWEDEVFAVSTAWSLARSQAPTPSVLAQYPHTGSPILFYGPVSFEAAAWLIRAFGLSPTIWRLACFGGILLCLFAGWQLVRLAGGERWAQVITALVIALIESVGSTLPGRWDAVTCGLFLSGLLLLLGGIERVRRILFWRSVLAGVLIGFALASTPRALTLSIAALVALVLTGLCFERLRGRFILGSMGTALTALLVHTLLLLRWGQTTLSWYRFVTQATAEDSINATPLAGRGVWTFDLAHHKTLTLLVFVLGMISAFNLATRSARIGTEKIPIKLCLTIFAFINSSLMLLVLANALGQAVFWLPPVIVATMCWVDLESQIGRMGVKVAVFLTGACLLLPFLQQAEQLAVVLLTWNRRSTTALTAFVKRTIPAGSVVYGPIGGYFFPVELSGDQYLYPLERTTPGLYSERRAAVATKLDEEICSHHTYAMWPKTDPVHNPQEQAMPEDLRERLQTPLGEFDQPAVAQWKNVLLQRMGEIGGKYGFPDAVIYSLNTEACGKDGRNFR